MGATACDAYDEIPIQPFRPGAYVHQWRLTARDRILCIATRRHAARAICRMAA